MTNRMKRKTGLNLDIRLPPYMSRYSIMCLKCIVTYICCRVIAEKGDIPSSYRSVLMTRVCPDPRAERPATLTRDRSRRTVARVDGDIEVGNENEK